MGKKPQKEEVETRRPLFENSPKWLFAQYKDYMLERDPVLVEQTKELLNMQFFDGSTGNFDHDFIILASYPRSGNTMSRAYIERVMGIPTGSDAEISIPLSK